MYPFGVTTLEGIISTAHTAFKLYQAARDRRTKVAAANSILKSFDVTLSKLEGSSNADHAPDKIGLEDQIRTARDAWNELEAYLAPFNPKQADRNRYAKSVRTAYLGVKWAVDDLDRKVFDLQHQVITCLTAITVGQITDMRAVLTVLTKETAELRQRLCSNINILTVDRAPDPTATDSQSQTLVPAAPSAQRIADIPCWQRRGGCHCRCHARTRIRANEWRYVFVDLHGWEAAVKGCNLPQTCNARQYRLQVRIAASKYGLPFAFTMALELQNHSWLPRLTLTPSRVCRYTAPGFVILWEIENFSSIDRSGIAEDNFVRSFEIALRQKLANFKRLLGSDQASFEDVDPQGMGYLEKVLRYPWSPGLRNVQRDLVVFLLSNSPEIVKSNSTLLYHCATWIGEGPHMDMLETVLSLGFDPGHMDVSLFRKWPRFCSPGWIAEAITPDLMFVDFIRRCLPLEPGFAGCDALSESLLIGSKDKFECAVLTAKANCNKISTPPNALGQTAVHLAIKFPKRLRKLLEAGAEVDCVDKDGITPLMYAAAYGNSLSVQYLLNHGADPCLIAHQHNRLFIHYAIRRRHLHVIRDFVDLLRSQGCSAAAQIFLDNCMGYHFWNEHDMYDTKIPEFLFKLGADADIMVNDRTLMHLAASEENKQVLARNGFTAINAQTSDGVTVLMKVVSDVESKIACWALQQGVSVKSSDVRGHTAVHHLFGSRWFCDLYRHTTDNESKEWDSNRHAKMVSCLHLLLASDASILSPDYCECACSTGGCTPLTFALHQIHPRMFGKITGSAIDLFNSIQTKCGRTELAAFFDTIFRYRKFEELGLKHTCCRGMTSDESCRGMYEHTLIEIAETRQRHKDLESILMSSTSPETVSDTKVIAELAKLYQLYERRSLDSHTEAVATHDRQGPIRISSKSHVVDYAADTFSICYHSGFNRPIRKLEIDEHKEWLQWSLQNRVKMYLQGRLQQYVDNGMRILSMLEVEMWRLRSEDGAGNVVEDLGL